MLMHIHQNQQTIIDIAYAKCELTYNSIKSIYIYIIYDNIINGEIQIKRAEIKYSVRNTQYPQGHSNYYVSQLVLRTWLNMTHAAASTAPPCVILGNHKVLGV